MNIGIFTGIKTADGFNHRKWFLGCRRVIQINKRLAVDFFSKGRKIRQLYYPGALKDPKNAKKIIAFSFDPDKPALVPKLMPGVMKPIAPTTKSEEEFEPGLPQGTAAPTRKEVEDRQSPPSAIGSKAPARRSWLPQKGRP